MAPNEAAEKAEALRDLKTQIRELQDYGEQEVIFKETSPPKRVAILYSMENGEPIPVFQYRLANYMDKRLPNGQPMFTADPTRAPAYRRGTHKCFMAEESPEREILAEIGIHKVCPAEHLQSAFAKAQHAEKKHRAEWRAYSEHLVAEKDREWRDQQRQQVEAMMALAGKAAVSQPTPVQESSIPSPQRQIEADSAYSCELCDWHPKPSAKKPEQALAYHMGSHR